MGEGNGFRNEEKCGKSSDARRGMEEVQNTSDGEKTWSESNLFDRNL